MSWWNRAAGLSLPDKRAILSGMYFGRGTAELDEALRKTFVETDLWSEVFKGHVDLIHGPKGAGKSAIYSLLISRDAELRKRGIVVVAAENVLGEPVFASLASHSDLDDLELTKVWKIYFLTLVAQELRRLKLTRDRGAHRVIEILEEASLLPQDPLEFSLGKALNTALRYVHPEITLPLPVPAPLPAPELKLTFEEPTEQQRQQGAVSLNNSFQLAGGALSRAKLTIWIIIDRLDVAFALDEKLEGRVLRALFRAMADLRVQSYRTVLKIFLCTGIWDRITGKKSPVGQKMPEASSFEGREIHWTDSALFDLVIRRLLYNDKLRSMYKVAPSKVLRSYSDRQDFFCRVFPTQVDTPSGRVDTFEWMLSQVRDGTGQAAPREVVLLLTQAREAQLGRLDVGLADLPGEQLFDVSSLNIAATEVSKFRLDRTLYAEYPDLKDKIGRLRGDKSEYSLEELSERWEDRLDSARRTAQSLVEVGFFAREGGTYVVPPLYQRALNLIGGVYT